MGSKKETKEKKPKIEKMDRYAHPKKIDWENARRKFEAHCSITEVIASLCVSRQTLYDRCIVDNGITLMEFVEQCKNAGKTLIKEAIFHKAIREKDNVQLVWLSKNLLGWSDRADITTKGESMNKTIIEVSSESAKNNLESFLDKVSKKEEKENDDDDSI